MSQYPVFMTTAPSVPAGSHQMRDNFSDHDPPRSSPYTAPSITPYLGLRSRLSQVWFNRWTILLAIVLARVLIACNSANHDIATSRAQALSACSSVEAMGSVMASMPHYLSQGVNDMAASGIEKSVNALMQSTTLAVTGVEEIVVFVINMMYGTYLCLISFAVNGSLHSAVEVASDAQNALNDLTKSLGDDLSGSVQTFQDAYNSVQKALSGATLGLASGVTLPTLNLTGDIDKLRQLQLPPSLGDDIKKLNNSIPNFVDIQNLTDNAIRFPFDKVKELINENLGNYTFDRSVFPVPQKENMEFCSGNNGIDDFFDNLNGTISTGKKIFIAILALAAILVCIPMAYREIRRWRTQKARSYLIGSHEHDPLDVVYIVSRPYTAAAGIKMSKGSQAERRQILIRWVVAYATSEAALFVLALAIAGLFSCLCHYILLRSIEREVPELTSQVAGFADQVVNKLTNASEQWAIGANKVISDTNNTINEDMFGWVNTSTTALNDTLTQFVDLTSKVLNETFGGTPLYDPIKDVLDCLVLLKVQGIQKGLTWIHDNAHISMPLMNVDTFSLGAAASIGNDSSPDQSFLASPGDVASDKISDVVERFVNAVAEQIRIETIISTGILCVYLIIVLSAVIRAATLWNGHDKVRGEGGAAPTSQSPQFRQADFRSSDQDRYVGQAVPMAHVVQPRQVNQDRYTTFDNIPLEPVNHHNVPAPRYSTAIEEKAAQAARQAAQRVRDNPFADSKHYHSDDEYDLDNKI